MLIVNLEFLIINNQLNYPIELPNISLADSRSVNKDFLGGGKFKRHWLIDKLIIFIIYRYSDKNKKYLKIY